MLCLKKTVEKLRWTRVHSTFVEPRPRQAVERTWYQKMVAMRSRALWDREGPPTTGSVVFRQCVILAIHWVSARTRRREREFGCPTIRGQFIRFCLDPKFLLGILGHPHNVSFINRNVSSSPYVVIDCQWADVNARIAAHSELECLTYFFTGVSFLYFLFLFFFSLTGQTKRNKQSEYSSAPRRTMWALPITFVAVHIM